jgi:hypothetical protein
MVLNNFTFHNLATAIGDGAELRINNIDISTSISFSITGTALTRTVVFECQGLNGAFIPLRCFNVSTGTFTTQTSGTSDETWIADLTALSGVRARISAIADGNLTVSGKVVG